MLSDKMSLRERDTEERYRKDRRQYDVASSYGMLTTTETAPRASRGSAARPTSLNFVFWLPGEDKFLSSTITEFSVLFIWEHLYLTLILEK